MPAKRKHRHRSSVSSSSIHRDHSNDPSETALQDPNAEVAQTAAQSAVEIQKSDEVIFIKDSCGINVQTTETEAAVSLQLALQLAIALVIKITIGTTDNTNSVFQELMQHFDSEQSNVQKIHIENSKDITISTTDTDIAANVQAMLQVLLTLVAKLEVL